MLPNQPEVGFARIYHFIAGRSVERTEDVDVGRYHLLAESDACNEQEETCSDRTLEILMQKAYRLMYIFSPAYGDRANMVGKNTNITSLLVKSDDIA